MFCGRFFENLKARFRPEKVMELSSFITPDLLKFGFYMRPTTDAQSSQMLDAYIRAARVGGLYGGHIFVSSARAAEVLRILDRLGAAVNVYSWPDLTDLPKLFDITKGCYRVNVYIEDDSAPYKERAARFLAVQELVRRQFDDITKAVMDPPLDDEYPFQPERSTKPKLHVMFVELNLQTKRGFSVYMAMLKQHVGFCLISRRNEFEYTVGQFADPAGFSEDEHLSIVANTIRIYGSGQKHQKEMRQSYDRVFTSMMSPGSMKKSKGDIDLDALWFENDHGLAFNFDGKPHLVDLTR